MSFTTSIAYPLMIAALLAASTTAQSPSPSPEMAVATSPEAPGPFYPMAPGPFYPMAPAPEVDCFSYLLNLSDCLTFVQPGSNLTTPDKGCCPELGTLVDTQPICLCKLLGDSSSLGISVDVSRALKLPTLCNVTTPPVSLCAAIGIPVSALTPSDAPSPGGDEAASPPSPGGDMGSATTFASKHHFLIGLAPLFITYFF